MTREEAGRRAELMQHYADGGEVEIKRIGYNWRALNAPEFDWDHYDYRKAQPAPAEPTYRPYANADEAIADGLDWVRDNGERLNRVKSFSDDAVILDGPMPYDHENTHTFARLFATHTKYDNTPCGIKETT